MKLDLEQKENGYVVLRCPFFESMDKLGEISDYMKIHNLIPVASRLDGQTRSIVFRASKKFDMEYDDMVKWLMNNTYELEGEYLDSVLAKDDKQINLIDEINVKEKKEDQ